MSYFKSDVAVTGEELKYLKMSLDRASSIISSQNQEINELRNKLKILNDWGQRALPHLPNIAKSDYEAFQVLYMQDEL